MKVNKCKEIRRCYNYEKTGHLAVRYPRPRKKRREEARIVEKTKKDFSLGKK